MPWCSSFNRFRYRNVAGRGLRLAQGSSTAEEYFRGGALLVVHREEGVAGAVVEHLLGEVHRVLQLDVSYLSLRVVHRYEPRVDKPGVGGDVQGLVTGEDLFVQRGIDLRD